MVFFLISVSLNQTNKQASKQTNKPDNYSNKGLSLINPWFSHQVIYKKFNIPCEQTLHEHEHEDIIGNLTWAVNGTEECEAKLLTTNSQVRGNMFLSCQLCV